MNVIKNIYQYSYSVFIAISLIEIRVFFLNWSLKKGLKSKFGIYKTFFQFD